MPPVITDSQLIPGLKLIKPAVFHDFRGEYVETFSAKDYAFEDADGQPITFVEDDASVSRRGTLRGLHGDRETWKLVQCLHGSIYVVIADMREDSPAYLRWEAFTLNDKNRAQVLVPAGCGTSHLVLSESCIFSYKQSQYYSGAQNQFSVRWNDPKLGIFWPISDPLLSERDAGAPLIGE